MTMAKRRSWHHIGHVTSDPCPGLSDSWDVYISRSRDGEFFISYGEKEEFEAGDAEDAAKWITEESGLDYCEVAEDLREIRGFKKVVHHMIGDLEDDR